MHTVIIAQGRFSVDVQAVLDTLGRLFDRTLFNLGEHEISFSDLLVTAVIIGLTFWFSSLAERAVRRAFRARAQVDEGTIGVAGRLVYYIVAATGLAVSLHTLGLNLSALFAAGAIFAVGLGFGLQNLVQNFMSGIILLGERTIKPGDILDVEGTMVKVEHLGLRSTVARTLDEETILIPNGTLVQTTVKNMTFRDRYIRLRTTVGVSYGSDLEVVFEVLRKAAMEHPERSEIRAPTVFLLGFGSSSVDFEVSIWLEDPWRAKPNRSVLNHLIWNALKEAGITIAFPQVDVHFDRRVVEAVGGRRD